MTFSGVTTGGHLTYVGGDYTRVHSPPLRVIELDLAMGGGSLTRLFYDEDAVHEWIAARRSRLEATLIPKRPSTDSVGMMGMFMQARDYNEDLQTFRGRVQEHLQGCRSVLLDNVLASIDDAYANLNKLVLKVGNPTDTPVEGVRVEASFMRGKAIVFLDAPGRKLWPSMPTWPDISDDFAWGRQLRDAGMRLVADAYMPFAPNERAHMVEDGDRVKVSYQIGNLRPGESQQTPPLTILPSLDDGDEIYMEVRAAAMNRRGNAEKGFVVQVDPNGWTLDAVIDPAFGL